MRRICAAALALAGCGDDGGQGGGDGTAATNASGAQTATGAPTTGTPTATGATATTSATGTTGAGGSGDGGSLRFVQNGPGAHDYGQATTIPAGFGSAEFTLELWIRPDASFPVGPTTPGTPEQLTSWSDADEIPYGDGDWWYAGNFLLDGHNNASFHLGTFSLQFYGGGRLRWLFGDGAVTENGGVWSVGTFPASSTPSLLDGAWHHVALVRRFVGASGASLELWIDGALVDDQPVPARTDMRSYWDAWPGFPGGQEGWFWGAEKQAAIGVLSQYEDYKGNLAELSFWSLAKDAATLATSWDQPVVGDEPGLAGLYRFDEGGGSVACDALSPSTCISLYALGGGAWDTAGPPL